MKNHVLRRVAALATVALGATVAITGCASSGSEGSDTLRVTLANHAWTEAIRDRIPEFEELTGLSVELTQLGEDQLSDQYNVKLNAGTDEIDVLMYRTLQEGRLFASNGYLSDLTDRVEESAEWDWADFQPSAVEATTYEGEVVGVPIVTDQAVLYYRSDLLAEAGLEVPDTLEELEAAAKIISESNEGVAGFVGRTAAAPTVSPFSSFLFSFGGEFIDEDGNSAIASDEAKEAYEYYGRLINLYGPENVSTDTSWPQAAAIFAQGNAAFFTDASSLYKNLTDEKNSVVSDAVGFAPFPAGPAGSKPYNVPGWALAMNEASSNQDAAWKFIEWATSPEMSLDIQKAGIPGPRTSVWANPEGTSSFPADLAATIVKTSEIGIGFDRPLVISVAEAREIVGAPIVAAITGGDVDAAAESANELFQQFLDDEKG